MAIKKYSFDYDIGGCAVFEVDTDLFTAEKAREVLDFFTWRYKKTNDPIDEVLKKYAMAVIRIASTSNYNTLGVVLEFNQREGFYPIDENEGLNLTYVEGYEFDEDMLDCTIA